MGWIRDDESAELSAHEGFVIHLGYGDVEVDMTSGQAKRANGNAVVGWAAGCDCGWRSAYVYPRSEHPSTDGEPPRHVEGSEDGTGCHQHWSEHVDGIAATSELQKATAGYRAMRHQLTTAVHNARTRGDVRAVDIERAERALGQPHPFPPPTTPGTRRRGLGRRP